MALACFSPPRSPLTSITFISVFMSQRQSAGRAAAVLQIIRPSGSPFAAAGLPLPRLIQLLHKSSPRHSCTMGVKRSKLRYIHVDARTRLRTRSHTRIADTKKWRRHAWQTLHRGRRTEHNILLPAIWV